VVEFAALAVADGVETVFVFGAHVPGGNGSFRFLPKRRFGGFVTY
jgi:hypothetical protein